MQIEIQGRQVEITPKVRDFVESRIGRLRRLVSDEADVHVMLGVEKRQHTAEIQLSSKFGKFSGREASDDLFAAIREASDKLGTQVRRHRDKIVHHKQRSGPRDPDAAASMDEAFAEEGVPELEPQIECEVPGTERVVHRNEVPLERLSIGEAALRLEREGKGMILFQDLSSGEMRVVVRRADGDYEVIVARA